MRSEFEELRKQIALFLRDGWEPRHDASGNGARKIVVRTACSLTWTLMACALVCVPCTEFAQAEQPSESSVQEVIVTTTRQSRRIADEPTRVEVIGPEELEEKVAMSPGDVSMLLNETSGLRVQMTSPGLGAANVRIQGLQGRYSQILADGLPLYGGEAGSIGLLQIPPLDLGQVEVLKGVASALYGASALGGVINFVSRRPDGAHELLLNQSSRQGTDAALWWAGAPVSAGWSYSLMAGLHHQTMQDVSGDGWADMPGFRRAELRPRLYWKSANGADLYATAGLMLEDRNGGTIRGGVVPEGDPTGASFPEVLKTQRYDAGLIGHWPLSDDRILSLRSSFTHRDSRQTFGDDYEPSRFDTGLIEVSLSGGSGPNHWVTGAAFQQDRYRNDALPGFDFTYNAPGLFAQDEYDVSRSVTLSASGRIDHHSQYGTFFSPRLATLWRPGGRASPWRVRLSLGSGFFAPTPNTEETEATGLARILPLTNLHAERARGVSADVDRIWELHHGTIEADFTAFGSQVEDAVNLVQANAIPPRFRFANDPEPTRAFGTGLLIRWRQGPFTVVATHAYVNSTEFPPDVLRRIIVPLNPRHAASLVATWEKESIGRIGIESFFVGHQSLTGTDTLNPYRTTSPQYVVLGLLLQRQIGPVNVFLNGENLNDRRLTRFEPLLLPTRAPDGRWTVDAWAPLDGRVINFGVRWRFRNGKSDRH